MANAPRAITMVDLRTRAEEIVETVRRGQPLVLTYRGEPVLRLEPIVETAPQANDPFYRLADDADATAASLSNDEIDAAVYGS